MKIKKNIKKNNNIPPKTDNNQSKKEPESQVFKEYEEAINLGRTMAAPINIKTGQYQYYVTNTIPVTDAKIASLAQKAMPFYRFANVQDYNKQIEDGIAKGKPRTEATETNQHPVSHLVRKALENELVVENIKLKDIHYTARLDIRDAKTLAAAHKSLLRRVIDDNEQNNKVEEINYFNAKRINRNAVKNIPHHDPLPVIAAPLLTEFDVKLSVPARPLIDINSNRALNANYADTVLTPQVDAADADRRRNVITSAEQLNDKFAEMEDVLNIDPNEMRDDYMRTFNMTIQQFAEGFENYEPRYGNNRKDAIYMLTDVIYYISNEDLYKVAEPLNDGTVYIGCMHVPKEYYTTKKLITFTNGNDASIEGSMVITTKTRDTEHETIYSNQALMLMEMLGNDHIYQHDVRFPDLATKRMHIIDTSEDTDFALKLIVQRRVDCGATYYISFKIVKITKPKLNDLLDDESMFDHEYINNLRQHIMMAEDQIEVEKENLPPMPQQFDPRMPRHLMIRDMHHRAEKKYKPAILAAVYQKPPEKMINPNYIPRGKAAAKLREVQNEANRIESTIQIANEFKNQFIIYRAKNGRVFTYHQMMNLTLTAIKEDFQITNVKSELINKITTKITLAQKIDADLLRSLVLYINREDPSLPIDTVITIIVKCISDNLTIEKQIYAIKNLQLTSLLNSFKEDEIKTLPQSLVQSFLQGKMFTYLKNKIYTTLKINEKVANSNMKLDF